MGQSLTTLAAASSPCRSAYATETRSIILSLDRVSKVAPNGKQILKNVGLGMYLGAKIGVLGQNGAPLWREPVGLRCQTCGVPSNCQPGFDIP